MEKRGKYTVLEVPECDLTHYTGPDGGQFSRWKVSGQDDLTQPYGKLFKGGFFPDLRLNLPKIKDMKCRNDDIFLCAYPKSGTHWVWEIANMLVTGELKYLTQIKEDAMMELHYPEEFDNVASPRILNTHLPFRVLPSDVTKKHLKIIFVQRNPKDVIVSAYNHMNKMKPENERPTFRDFVNWFQYTLKWEKVMAENPEYPIHMVYYESLKKNPEEEIARLARFLGKDRDETFIAEVAKMCRFSNMKKANDQVKDHSEYPMFDKLMKGMYRKGEIGDWKNWFTVAQNLQYDEIFKEKMKDSKLKFVFT
ncbi:sulfotransferase 1B1-like [Ylistrum balloti]|uniref:sulfotransferase 1B1-like n=1 Tax=Ylistrum balloti TaxID=509963 RepID=UPI002905EC26|nr:sulfotransferase 1B1-like [Ylistrum balloti]